MAKRPWYPRFPSDYAVDTRSLNLAEHGAYALLMDTYYFDCKLEGEREDMHRICNASGMDELKAVDKVLARFFKFHPSTADIPAHWTQTRVEKELEKYEKTNKSKAEGAQKRWGKNADASGMDNLPNQNQNHNHNQNNNQPSASGEGSADAERPGPSLQNAVQNPTPVDTIDSNPVKAESSKELKKSAREILAYLNRATGKKFQDVDSNLEPIIARLKEGATPEQIKSVVAERVQVWGTDEKMAEFLRPDTLFRRTKFWNYLGNITMLDK